MVPITQGIRKPQAGGKAAEMAAEAARVRQETFERLERNNPGFSKIIPVCAMGYGDLEKLARQGVSINMRRGVYSAKGKGYGVPLVSVQEVGTGRVLMIGKPGENNSLLPVPTEHLDASCRLYRELRNPGKAYRQPRPED